MIKEEWTSIQLNFFCVPSLETCHSLIQTNLTLRMMNIELMNVVDCVVVVQNDHDDDDGDDFCEFVQLMRALDE